MRTPFALLLALTSGCVIDAADIETDDPIQPPDITGSYAVVLSDISGCDGTSADLAWAESELRVAGPADVLDFEFPGGTLIGSIDAAFTWEASGTVALTDATHEAAAEGIAFIGDQTWVLDGDLSVEVIGSTAGADPCTLTARMEAEQNPL